MAQTKKLSSILTLPELGECHDEWAIYLQICADYKENVVIDEANLLTFWQVHAKRIPRLFNIAKWLLCFPINTAEFKRSISHYNNILTKYRNSLTENNLKALNFIQFNSAILSKKHKSNSIVDGADIEVRL